jgi:hypothetical protein
MLLLDFPEPTNHRVIHITAFPPAHRAIAKTLEVCYGLLMGNARMSNIYWKTRARLVHCLSYLLNQTFTCVKTLHKECFVIA